MKEPAKHILQSFIFWEISRIFYNLLLFAVVAGHFIYNYARSIESFSLDKLLFIIVLAIIANILYCSSYIVDFILQKSENNNLLKIGRIVVLLTGTVLSCILAHFMSYGLFPQGSFD